jgi:hypothetical protein
MNGAPGSLTLYGMLNQSAAAIAIFGADHLLLYLVTSTGK